MRPVEEQLPLLMRGVVYEDENVARAMESELRERLAEGRPLRVYLGIDPTAPDLTLGHTVAMRKLRQFQDLGHEAILVIGGFTSLIGDPSDKESARPMLTPEEIEANAQTYLEQAFTVLDRERTVIRNNAEWLGKLTFQELIRIASNFTVGQFLQRDNFALRRERGEPIYVHEFFYAFMQAYDAVALETDVQVGGTDQLFNLMAGRTLQRAYGQRPQIAITTPILVGTDGRMRMSKSQGNHIALQDPPADMYGKVMSLPDDVMLDYFTLVTDVSADEIEEMRRQVAAGGVEAMNVKKRLAHEIVADIHGAEAAQQAEEAFSRTFQRRNWGKPDLAASFTVELPIPFGSEHGIHVDAGWLKPDGSGWDLIGILADNGIVESTSEARRLIRQGAIDVDGVRVTTSTISIRPGSVIRVGKHTFLRIVDADKGG